MLVLPKIPPLAGFISAEALGRHLRDTSLVLEIATENWPGTGGRMIDGKVLPRTVMSMAHDGTSLYLYFSVLEHGVQARFSRDQEQVWRDSCVELFISPVQALSADTVTAIRPEGYYNFEFNAIGTMLAWFGTDRHARIPQPLDVCATVERKASLGTAPFAYREETLAWELGVRIPLAAFRHHALGRFDGHLFALNAYKCGDELPVKHYLSWNRISSAQPDFHRPECFGLVRCASDKD